ncbi:MAG TPA: RecX family transcriptional regulator [Anaeromyxobacteraceae bacterium]|nr:RecX family transcriptional regulator [Anaeromyxobacteraceae bacterium]
MSDESPLDRAKSLSLRVLAFHARTEQQLRRRLAAAGLEAEADGAVAWLLRLGYLDDAAWARATARSLLRPGRLGPLAAERRLLAAGIAAAAARAAVAAALAEAPGGEGGAGSAELALCRALAEKRARGARPADLDERARARLSRFLLGRGFSGQVVHRVVGLGADADP